MDLKKVIEELKSKKLILDRAIAELEKMQQTGRIPDSLRAATPTRRGRKSMDPKERREVSARMKRYWAARPQKPSSR
jgi:hypothetical protein